MLWCWKSTLKLLIRSLWITSWKKYASHHLFKKYYIIETFDHNYCSIAVRMDNESVANTRIYMNYWKKWQCTNRALVRLKVFFHINSYLSRQFVTVFMYCPGWDKLWSRKSHCCYSQDNPVSYQWSEIVRATFNIYKTTSIQ